MSIKLGDCKALLKELPDNSVHSVITDVPYNLNMMGRKWDNTGIAYDKEMWAECLRVLKQGGHLLSFSHARTYHRIACAIEDSGFDLPVSAESPGLQAGDGQRGVLRTPLLRLNWRRLLLNVLANDADRSATTA